jgi:histidinol-phosphate phosphatase family protein
VRTASWPGDVSQAVILAGGRGQRLAGALDAPAKALVPLCGRTVIEHVLTWLGTQGVTDLVMCLGYRAAEIAAAVGDGGSLGLRVRYHVETSPLGTAGAVQAALPLLGERFFVVYSDVVADVDLRQLAQAHAVAASIATLAVHPNDHPFDSDRVVTDRYGYVQRIVRPSDDLGPEAGALCSAALYLLERRAIEPMALTPPCDFAHDVFPALLASGERLLAYRTTEYIKDMGTPARRIRVETDLAENLPRQMRRSALRPAVLLDRDGVIIEDVGHLPRGAAPRLLTGAVGALRRVNGEHALAVCCTNQPVIARGEQDEDGLHQVHRLLEGLLAAGGAWLDAIYTCPHHPERGFAGERVDLKIACTCRKPLPGLLLRAVAELGIDRRRSIVIGDRTTDLAAAQAAGILAVGVRTGAACKDGRIPIAAEIPIVDDVGAAVSLLLDTAPSWRPWLETIRDAGSVVLGGSSGVGKTAAAAALRLALAAVGIESVHVSLDRFALAPRDLAALTFEGWRHGAAVLLPGYDAVRRLAAPSHILQRDRRTVTIIEGVLANQLQIPGAFHIALHASREARQARRHAGAHWKGVERAAIEAMDRRDAAESPEVERACARVSLRLVLNDQFQLQESP